MAAAKSKTVSSARTFKRRNKVSRPGVHAKTKQSKNKNGKNYSKPYRGQGR